MPASNIDLSSIDTLNELGPALNTHLERILGDQFVVIRLTTFRQLLRAARSGSARESALPKQATPPATAEQKNEALKMLGEGHQKHRIAELTGLTIQQVNAVERFSKPT